MSYNGKLIVLEGPDGSGKSYHTQKLHERLTGSWLACLPADKKFIERVSKLDILHRSLAYNIDRALLVHEVLIPNLNKGKTVLCDRGPISNITMLASEYILHGNLTDRSSAISTAMGYLNPLSCPWPADMTIIFGAEESIMAERIKSRGDSASGIDNDDLLQRKLRYLYGHDFTGNGEIVRIDTSGDREKVADELYKIVTDFINSPPLPDPLTPSDIPF